MKFHLYNFCKKHEWFGKTEFSSQFDDKFSELMKIFSQENKPVVLSFETSTESIASENGSTSQEYIDWFLHALDSSEMRQDMAESLRIIQPRVISPENIWISVFSDGNWSNTIRLTEYPLDL